MAIGLWIKSSDDSVGEFFPLSGERSFKLLLEPLIRGDDSFTWLLNLPTGLTITRDNVQRVIEELQLLQRRVRTSQMRTVREKDFLEKRIEQILYSLIAIGNAGFQEAFLG